MQVQFRDRVTVVLPKVGVLHPGIVWSEPTSELVTITNRDGEPVEITVTRADVISYRQNLAGEFYYALTNETVQYGFRPILLARYKTVVGLDVTEDGEVIDDEMLTDLYTTSYSAFVANGFEASSGAVLAATV